MAKERRQSSLPSAAAATCAALAVAMPLPAAASLLEPKGPVGAALKLILYNSLVIMLAIVIPTIVLTIAFAWWFRAGNKRATYLPDWAYSGKVELVVWAIPTMVVIFLAGIAWIGSHQLDPYRPLADDDDKHLEVQVVSLDWKWLFIYPAQNVASVNELVLPAGVPVRFRLTSASVMNAFFVPQLGSMIYTMNGMETKLHLQADAPGVFEGMSAHYSGDGFSGMRFMARSVPAAEFAAWARQATNLPSSAVLDRAAYARLAEQSSNVRPFAYRAVEPGLFDAVVSQAVAEGPGPRAGSPNVDVSPVSKRPAN